MGKTKEEIERELAKPLDASKVKKRAGKGGSGDLSYLAAHDVKREMNEVFGRLGWSMSTSDVEILREHEYQGKLEVVARAKVTVTVSGGGQVCQSGSSGWDPYGVSSDGVGVGNGTSKVGGSAMDAYELALKEAESDAFKRACVRFGDRFGLVLYDKEAPRLNRTGKAAPDVSKIETIGDLDAAWKTLAPDEKKAFQEVFSQRKKELS